MLEYSVRVGEEMREFQKVLEALLVLAKTFDENCNECPLKNKCSEVPESSLCDWAIQKGTDYLIECETGPLGFWGR